MQRIALLVLMVFMMAAAFIAFITLTGKPALNPFAKPETNQGEATIGGTFTLTDQHGKTVSDKDFRGKYMLVYFGYSYCPEICPTDLLTISQTMAGLGADADRVAPVFITIDPERDTVEQLRTYMQNFDPRITALTGAKDIIAKVQQSYKVYSHKSEDTGASEYLMDHSAITYLMDTNGKYLDHFPHGTSSTAMVAKIEGRL